VLANGDDWRLAHEIMMNRYQRYVMLGTETALPESIAWGTVASKKPNCPRIIVDFVSSLEARRGNELAGWMLYLNLAESTPNEDWKDDYTKDSNYQRRHAMLQWARAFEEDEKRFPSSLDEAMTRALPTTRQTLERNPALQDLFRADVEFVPERRDVLIAPYVEFMEAYQQRLLEDYALVYEAENGRPPEDLAEVAGIGRIPGAPRHGTKWAFEPEERSFRVVEWPQDPRLFTDWR
ncbi:MAG: hypothetical protein ACYTG4_13205, partial [Planctomycetota bacterium]